MIFRGKEMSIDYRLIGRRIKKARKTANLTQENLAELMDVSVGYISQVERGFTKANLLTLDNICMHIGTDLIYVLTGFTKDGEDYVMDDFYREFYELPEKHRGIVIDIVDAFLK